MALAKTTRPSIRGIVPRPRAFRILDRARPYPVTWVCGPPGCGKTSLVASYVRARRLSCLWYQVDEGDTDIATFFHYLREAAPDGKQNLPRLHAPHPPSATSFRQQFFRQLFDTMKPPFAVVLDDYEDARESASFDEVILEAVSQIPPGGRMMILSRAVPPDALVSLIANRSMQLVTWPELRLTERETALLVKRVGARRLWPSAVKALHRFTDGWAAGLVLLLDQLKSEVGAAGWRQPDPKAVFDYVGTEILRHVDRETQEILLQVAFLPRVSGRMAEQLTGLPGAGRILGQLHAQNYFTIAHGTEDPAYEFHPLLRKALLSHGRRVFSRERATEIQRAGAAILEESGQIPDAVGLLIGAEDWPKLADVVCRHAASLLAEGRGQSVLDWIGRMPRDVLDDDPWLVYWHAVAMLSLDAGRARASLERALDGFRERKDATGAFLAWSAVVETFLHEFRDLRPLDGWVSRLGELRHEFPAFPSLDVEACVVASVIPALYLRQPWHVELGAWIDRAEQLFRSGPTGDLRLQIGVHLVWHACCAGTLANAAGIIPTLAAMASNGTASPWLRVLTKATIGFYQWLAGSLDASLQTVTEALALARTSGVQAWEYRILWHSAAAHLSRGDTAAAGDALDSIARDLQTAGLFDLLAYDYLVAWRALLQHDLPHAAAAQQRSLHTVQGMGIPFGEVQLRLAGIWIELLRTPCPAAAVRRQLCSVYRMARNVRSPLMDFSAHLAAAYFRLVSGREEQGMRCLAKAMRIGREHGFRNTYTWLDPVMARLCAKAMAAGIEPEYVRALVRERGLTPDPPPVELEQWPWPVKIFTLGRFEVWRDGELIRFSGKAQKRPLSLLKGLIALGGENVREDRLSDLLWPDADGDAAQDALSTTLHRLRQLLTHEAICRQAGWLRLARRHCWVDVWALDHMLERAGRLVAGSKPSDHAWTQSAQWTERAVQLYRGDFLADDSDAPWAVPFAERVRERLLVQIKTIARHWAQDGDWATAAACYKRATDIHACSEECCRGLMVAYQKLGRRDEAVAVYQRCTQTLNTRWGIAPSAQTVALLHSLKSGQTTG